MAVRSDTFREFVIEQLQGVRDVRCKSMFGGYGLYAGERFFGIIYKGRLYFKVSEASKPRYTSAGMKPFKPSAKMLLKSFYEVPADVLEDSDEIAEWAAGAIQAANKKHKRTTGMGGRIIVDR